MLLPFEDPRYQNTAISIPHCRFSGIPYSCNKWHTMNYPGASPQVYELFSNSANSRTLISLASLVGLRRLRERGIIKPVSSSTYTLTNLFALLPAHPDTVCYIHLPGTLRMLQLHSHSRVRLLLQHNNHPTRTLLPITFSLTVNCNRFLGYTKGNDGKLVIDPEQSEVVKRIYREYLEGSSMDKISAGLEADGILTGAGKEKWHTSTINKILRNEKYMGDALLQKTYTTDFLTKKRIRNNGTVPQYYVEDDHEAIIPKELFMQVQEELVRRRVVHKSPSGKKRTYSCNHCFAQIIVCGECGELYRRVHWNNRGKKSVVWRCVSRLENTGLFCEARTVLESTLEQVMVTAINQALCDKDHFLITLQKNIETVICHENSHTLSAIDKRLTELQAELLKLASLKADYEKVGDEIYRLRDEKQRAQVENLGRDELQKRINDMSAFLKYQPIALVQYDEALVRRLIEKVTVYEDKFTVEFNE
jgi:site-specific DNA recombinase